MLSVSPWFKRLGGTEGSPRARRRRRPAGSAWAWAWAWTWAWAWVLVEGLRANKNIVFEPS